MKATELLKRQHREVRAAFKQAEKSEDPAERKELVAQIIDQLQMHTQIEEQIFYPAVREIGTKKAMELIDESFEEHHVVDLVLAELPQADVEDGDKFCAKISVLHELVEHHVEEEEEELFKIAQKLGDEKLRELGAQMEAMAEGEEAEMQDVDVKEKVEREPDEIRAH